MGCHEFPWEGEFIFEKSNSGGLIRHSFSCSSLIFLRTTCKQNTSSVRMRVNPQERGCCTSCIPALGFCIQGRDWSQEDVAEGSLQVLLLAVSSPASCWGLGSATNGGPSSAESSRPAKIPLPGCKRSTKTEGQTGPYQRREILQGYQISRKYIEFECCACELRGCIPPHPPDTLWRCSGIFPLSALAQLGFPRSC